MAKRKRTVRAGRVFVTTVEDGQGKRVYLNEPESVYPVTVATTKGGIDALVDALKDASLELFGD